MTSVKKGRGRKPVHKDGLFDDLQDFSKGEISEKISSIKAGIEAGEKEMQRMQQERESEIALVQSLRTIQETTRGNSKERNELLTEFRKIRDKAQKTKAERDQINQNVPPPLEIIEQRLSETHRRLATIPNDLTSVDEEMRKRMFRFFEFCRSHNLHTFVITERQAGENAELEGNEGFLADCILNLGLDRRNGQIVRTLQIEKMRHVRHSMEKQAMEVTGAGVSLLGPLFD